MANTAAAQGNPGLLWQVTWKRTLLLLLVALIPVLLLGGWFGALSVAIGTLLMLGDLSLLSAPFDFMRRRTEQHKRSWVLALSLGRLLLLAGVLLLLVKLRVLNIPGALLGATLPIPALVSAFLTGGLTAWKV